MSCLYPEIRVEQPCPRSHPKSRIPRPIDQPRQSRSERASSSRPYVIDAWPTRRGGRTIGCCVVAPRRASASLHGRLVPAVRLNGRRPMVQPYDCVEVLSVWAMRIYHGRLVLEQAALPVAVGFSIAVVPKLKGPDRPQGG